MSKQCDMGSESGFEGLLRVNEAAAMLAVSPRTIWRMIADEDLTRVIVRGCTRVRSEEVAKYLKGGSLVGCL